MQIGEGYDSRYEGSSGRERAAREDQTHFGRAMMDARDNIISMSAEAGMPEVLVPLLAEAAEPINQLVGRVDAFVRAGVDQPPGRALDLLAAMSAVECGVADVSVAMDNMNATSQIAGSILSTITNTLSKIKSALGKAGAWLWSLISHLTSPKEWSVKGSISIAGLANAEIEVKF